MTVADLLTASRRKHREKMEWAGQVDRKGSVLRRPSHDDAVTAIAAALSLRLQADALDPEHIDPAWGEDLAANRGVTHAALVAFFQLYPTIV